MKLFDYPPFVFLVSAEMFCQKATSAVGFLDWICEK